MYRNNPRKAFQMISKAADSLTWFDITDRTLPISGDWGLLPLQVETHQFISILILTIDINFLCCVLQPVLSCSIPAFYWYGSLSHIVSFPQWLGTNPKHGRLSRVLHELNLHTYTKSFASPMAVNQDCIQPQRQRLTYPIIHEVCSSSNNVL